ncbi:MAG TPA: zinc ribbon domain-containing protein [Gemmatimonadales bacterium]|nr:zinc ribbon domain-containing protein [Gemmatimonadales bacterium]
MIYLEAFLALMVGAAALSLILLPLLRPAPARPAPAWEIPDLEETRKGQALIALKEIDFDLATGKLSEADHAELKRRFTAEAVAAMKEDAGGGVAAPARTGTATLACPTCGPRPESDALFCSSCGQVLTEAACGWCGGPLAPGARFCESCGRSVNG